MIMVKLRNYNTNAAILKLLNKYVYFNMESIKINVGLTSLTI